MTQVLRIAPSRPLPYPSRAMTSREFTRSERRLAMAAVLIVLLLSALDQTIVSTAMPRIIAELQGLERIAWVGTAYLLTSTVTVPIYGKLGDLYGRRPILIFGVIVFLAGSMLCGLAGEFGALPLVGDGMNQLIVCRAIQGVGAGALTTGAFATVADLVPPAERGRYTGLFGAMFGFASVAGPVIGGLLTEHATTQAFGHVISGWRFVFYVNLPLGAVALWVLINHLPLTGATAADDRRIDWLGSGLIIAAFVPLLLALSWGGHSVPWGSPRIVVSFIGGLAALIALILVSRGKSYAVVPLGLFNGAVFRRGNIALFLVNVAFMGIVMFFPLYLQVARGAGATDSGFALLPFMGGVLSGSIVAGTVARKTQQYKPVLIFGGLTSLAGVVLLMQVGPETSRGFLLFALAVTGLGLGPAQGMFTLAIQSSVEPKNIGVATSSAQFFRQIGSTIGVAVFGALLTNHLASELPRRAPALVADAAQVDISAAQRLAMDTPALEAALRARGTGDAATVARTSEGLKASFSSAILGLFPISALIMLVGFLVTLTMPGLRLRGRGEPGPTAAEAAAA